MEAQPIGASGQDLGATSVVTVETEIEQTGQKLVIPCFVMTSVKPIWQGNVKDCAMVLGTNALVEFGFHLVHADGSVVTPTTADPKKPAGTAAVHVVLAHAIHLAPGQTKQVEVITECTVGQGEEVGVVTPIEEALARHSCDFLECLWTGENTLRVEMNNWGVEPVTLGRGQQVGVIEPVTMIPADDPLWTEEEAQVLLCQTDDMDMEARVEELRQQLQFGEDLDTFEQVLLSHADVFALTDEELGETRLVTHHIDNGDAKPVRTLPR